MLILNLLWAVAQHSDFAFYPFEVQAIGSHVGNLVTKLSRHRQRTCPMFKI